MIPSIIKTDDPYVVLIDNIVPKSFCDQVISISEQNGINNHPGKVINNTSTEQYSDPDYRRCYDMRLTKGGPMENIRSKLEKYFLGAIEIYNKNILTLPRECEFEAIRVHKYPNGGFFRPHVDARYPKDMDNRGYGMYRILTVILYLKDCESGHTAFHNQKMAIPPQKGKILIFPTYRPYVHSSMPTKGETKYTVTTWFCNKQDIDILPQDMKVGHAIKIFDQSERKNIHVKPVRKNNP